MDATDAVVRDDAVDASTGLTPDVTRTRRRRPQVLALVSIAWIVVVVVAAIGADLLPLQDPNEVVPTRSLQSPSAEHWLGTDSLGRDQFSRVVHGSRVSVAVSVTAVVVGVSVGGLLGIMAGFFRGRLEGAVLAVSDVVLSFPGLVLLLVLLAYVGRSLIGISIIIGALSIPLYARVARANTLAVTEREYVRAARVLGASRTRVLIREILPNIALPVSAYAFVALGRVIVLEGSLAFLGLSVKPPDPTWGQMIADSKRHISDTIWPLVGPGTAMFLTVLSLSLVGERMRRLIDVKGEA